DGGRPDHHLQHDDRTAYHFPTRRDFHHPLERPREHDHVDQRAGRVDHHRPGVVDDLDHDGGRPDHHLEHDARPDDHHHPRRHLQDRHGLAQGHDHNDQRDRHVDHPHTGFGDDLS